jgi:hypothetical protein
VFDHIIAIHIPFTSVFARLTLTLVDLTFLHLTSERERSLARNVLTGYEPKYDKYSLLSLQRIILTCGAPMLASREFFNPSDDFFVIRADIDDSPLVEIPLIELFDLATFTLVESYQQVLDGYVIELLEDTTWVDEQSFSQFLHDGYGICCEMETGRFHAMERRDLQSFILQNLRNCNANDRYFAVPLLIKFSVSNADQPRRHRRFKECCYEEQPHNV